MRKEKKRKKKHRRDKWKEKKKEPYKYRSVMIIKTKCREDGKDNKKKEKMLRNDLKEK